MPPRWDSALCRIRCLLSIDANGKQKGKKEKKSKCTRQLTAKKYWVTLAQSLDNTEN